MPISSKQWKALTKRGGDFLEKLSIVGFGYAFFQGNTDGAVVGVVCIIISVMATFWEARE